MRPDKGVNMHLEGGNQSGEDRAGSNCINEELPSDIEYKDQGLTIQELRMRRQRREEHEQFDAIHTSDVSQRVPSDIDYKDQRLTIEELQERRREPEHETRTNFSCRTLSIKEVRAEQVLEIISGTDARLAGRSSEAPEIPLISAVLVNAESAPSVHPTEPNREETCCSQIRNRCLVFVISAVILVLINIALLVFFLGDDGSDDTTTVTSPPTMAFTAGSTIQPTTIDTTSSTTQPTIEPGFWRQVGQLFEGEVGGSGFGWYVTLSADRETLAVGAPLDSSSGLDNSGKVQIYRINQTTDTWYQIGQDLFGNATNDYFGRSMDLTHDGSIVAIGADESRFQSEASSGRIQVYGFDEREANWKELGQEIFGQDRGDWLGRSVSLSANGTTLADGARFFGKNREGRVQVFRFDIESTTWKQIGEDLLGKEENEYFGTSVSISGDGTVLAVGSYTSRFSGQDYGQVQVFQYDGTLQKWIRKGDALFGQEEGDYFGAFISISSDGQSIAVSAYRNDFNQYSPGTVRVFRWDGAIWQQLGQILVGKSSYDNFGYSVSLSHNGSVLAVGARQSGHPEPKPPGYAQVFRLLGNRWVQIGEDLKGMDDGDIFGRSVCLAGAGAMIAVGAPQSGDKEGYVQVFRFEEEN